MSEENLVDGSASNNILEEEHSEESFADLFEKSGQLPVRLDPGERTKSRIISISGDFVFIDLGGKSEGVVDLKEFKDEDGRCQVAVGDEIEVYFASVSGGLKRFTTLAHGLSTLDVAGIRNASDADLPVSGKVTGVLKGGYEVHVGKVRCFCPYSQMDLKGSRDEGQYIGETFPFKVLEYGEEGRNIILSRRVLLEEEQEARVRDLKETLQIGTEVAGKIRSVQRFGLFVDLGGLEGLIPTSEIGWDRMDRPEDFFSVGQEVSAQVIGLDWERNRLTLSLKALQPNPWTNISEKYTPDTMVSGTIVRLTPFGAFVNLEPGVDGLIHISKLGAGRRIAHPKEVVQAGQPVNVYVVAVDEKNKKISLSMEENAPADDTSLPAAGDLLSGTVERVISAGVLLRLGSHMTGFIPNSEMGTPRGTNHSRMFPPGTTVQVVVAEVDSNRRRITLSRRGVDEVGEKEAFDRYKTTVTSGEKSDSTLGSFGELLMKSLEKKKG
jgi:small subunit ribosomal protein S1